MWVEYVAGEYVSGAHSGGVFCMHGERTSKAELQRFEGLSRSEPVFLC
jgi:hypothetical protein